MYIIKSSFKEASENLLLCTFITNENSSKVGESLKGVSPLFSTVKNLNLVVSLLKISYDVKPGPKLQPQKITIKGAQSMLFGQS